LQRGPTSVIDGFNSNMAKTKPQSVTEETILGFAVQESQICNEDWWGLFQHHHISSRTK
jgi:hypothetical protein